MGYKSCMVEEASMRLSSPKRNSFPAKEIRRNKTQDFYALDLQDLYSQEPLKTFKDPEKSVFEVSKGDFKDEYRFLLRHVQVEQAAVLRKILISRIYSMAIDSVEISENSSALPDESIAHRLGLLPIYCSDMNAFSLPEDCSCSETSGERETCEQCSVSFSLHVECADRQKRMIRAKDLVYSDNRCSMERQTDISLFPLRQGELVSLHGRILKGCGAIHAKWDPVAAVTLKPNKEEPHSFYCGFESTGQLGIEEIAQQAQRLFKQELSC